MIRSKLLIFFFVLSIGLFSQSKFDLKNSIVVDSNGSGHFRKVQQAIDSVRAFNPSGLVTIFIKKGVYFEKLNIPTHICNLHIVGESRDSTILRYNDYAGLNKMGTFRTFSLKVSGNNITIENLTIENNSTEPGQAVALHVEGDRIIFSNCKIVGNQDTIYLGCENTRQLFENCYIEGTTDFIFGPSTAWFEACEIYCKRNSYITAASTPSYVKFGFVFHKCKISLANGVESVYLGRPWRAYAMTAFINCYLPNGINQKGWFNWDKVENESTARYYEYKNYGAGSSVKNRVGWAKQLNAIEIKKYAFEKFFERTDNWTPGSE